jgi:phosphoglycerate dehydrogenase-like enzyme
MTGSPDHPILMKLLVAAFSHLDLWTAPEWFAERLQTEFPQMSVARVTSGERLSEEIGDATVLFCGTVKPEQFLHARQLRWIHSSQAAVHQFLFPELINSNVVLTNAREVHGVVVSEHVMALMFALARRIPESVRFQREHVWGQELLYRAHQTPQEIADATVGLVGLGSIGRNVAQRASAMGMRVIAVREHADRPKSEHVDEVLPTSQLQQMLAKSDYVVLSPPVTPATRGMIGRDQLAAMKREGYLINVGRGPLIDEAALIQALREHRIAGAALDVFDHEPLPPESPLWDLDNLLITPHTGGMTEKMWERHYTVFAENLRRFVAGQPLLAVVDKQAGY